MKIVADNFGNAGPTLQELFELEGIAMDMWVAMRPFSQADKGVTLPRYITTTATEIRGLLVKDFAMSFPAINSLVVNGDGASENSYSRLHDAIFSFNDAQQAIVNAGCVFRDDASRERVREKLARVVGDLCVFICVQYDLRADMGEAVRRSVQEKCDRMGITPEVLYGMLLQDMTDVGSGWYAYEAISPYCAPLSALDQVLVNECEEALFPLTEQMAESLLDGTIDAAYVRGLLLEYSKGAEEKEVAITPATLISQMKLK